MSSQQELIRKIESFDIDTAEAPGAFAERLSKEQNWSLAFTNRAIREYKRFVILAMISEREVTPSKTVDEVWHLHLIFTDSYWNRMTSLLPKPLHHNPGLGQKGERLKYKEQFRYTLDLYRKTFGIDAPHEVWGAMLPPPRTPANRMLVIGIGLSIGVIVLVFLISKGALLLGLVGLVFISLLSTGIAYSVQHPVSVQHQDQRRNHASDSSTVGGSGSCGSTGCGSAHCGDTSGSHCGSDSGGDGGDSGGDGGSCGGGCGGGGD